MSVPHGECTVNARAGATEYSLFPDTASNTMTAKSIHATRAVLST